MKYVALLAALALIAPAGFAQDERQETLYKERIAAKIAGLAFDGESALLLADADTGRPLAGATVRIDGAGSFVSDADGLAVFPTLKDGRHKFSVQKAGFIQLDDSFEVVFGSVLFYKYSLPPLMPLGRVKIVLDWGKEPADLDLHLVKEKGYHISFRDAKKSADGDVWLDRDCKTGYGPETLTIGKTDAAAEYRVYVHDYTNRGQKNSAKLFSSRAVVRVYSDNKLVNTFAVAPGGRGDTWDVFTISKGKIE
jgi:hypothetical protein